jgi:hypothetical protein
MNDHFTSKKDALKALRYDRIRKNKFLWILFLLSVVLSFVCPFLINHVFCDIFYPTENAILNGLANISCGYFSGFLVYLFSSFFPETKRDIEIRDSIFFNLYIISTYLENIEKDFIPEDVKRDSKTVRTNLCNYLVQNANLKNFWRVDDLPSASIVNKIHFGAMKMRLTLLNEQTEKLITSYRRELRSEEIEDLSSLANLKKMFEVCVNSSKTEYHNDKLYYFIIDYTQYSHLFYSRVCPEYKRFKYCKYDIPR